MRAVLHDVTVFVTTIGDATNFADCLSHLHAQTVSVPIEIIDHVAPMSAAFQEMLVRCQTEYYVQVDEDMILFSDAIRALSSSIASLPERFAMTCAPLWDCDAECPIYGVKIYRAAIMKQFPYRDSASCEIEQLDRLRASGHDYHLQTLDKASCLGEHGKHYTLETIFKRWQRCFQKHRLFGNMDWIEPYARRLLDRYLATRESLHLYAFLGAVAGITDTHLPDSEQDWRVLNEGLERLKYYFPTE